MSYDFKKFKENSLTRPRDEAWGNWKSWKDAKIGDMVQGFIADAFYRPEELNSMGAVAFKEQRGITIRQTDGTLINVGVKFLPFVLAATDNLRVGDPLTVEFAEETEGGKGINGAKIFKYYGANLPENKGNKTVKELTDEDRGLGGTASATPVEEIEGAEGEGGEGIDAF